MAKVKETPLSGPPPEEIQLPRAPLVRVVAQVKFPKLLILKEEHNLTSFQERIRDVYPILTKDDFQNARVELGLHGASIQSEASVIWRFVDESGNWRLSLAPDFVSLETKRYESRKNLLERLSFVLDAVEETYRPKIVTRVGLRYVDQLKDDAVANASQLIKKEVMGIFGLVESERIRHGISEIGLRADEGDLLVRWGQLPPNSTFDPNIVEPIDTTSWVLDLDLSSEEQRSFATRSLKATFDSFAERVYAMFRWIITDDFLKHYGGKI